ncbi:MAG: hypothetical protein DHS20C14_18810 [Phycisphaeraceae bacterium]|nr:MAG: hypothetical protein DHS20C14_18810 [Phycisphaeraceae bacterium]
MTEFPRLHVDEPEPPAPIPFREHWRDTNAEGGRPSSGRWTKGEDRDVVADAERALSRAQDALNELDRMVDEDHAPFRFRPDDDDGPRAA